jgi:hypothetical protein
MGFKHPERVDGAGGAWTKAQETWKYGKYEKKPSKNAVELQEHEGRVEWHNQRIAKEEPARGVAMAVHEGRKSKFREEMIQISIGIYWHGSIIRWLFPVLLI